ncbi:Uncharacterised protein [Mycobacteroides abscessus subsp. abscessus]|nr:Uncharacterised protein [Mycobacteroides abscessus subsp. abscessus]
MIAVWTSFTGVAINHDAIQIRMSPKDGIAPAMMITATASWLTVRLCSTRAPMPVITMPAAGTPDPSIQASTVRTITPEASLRRR